MSGRRESEIVVCRGSHDQRSAGLDERRKISVGVDEELAVIESGDAAVLDPFLGDVMQDSTLRLPHHPVPSTLDLEPQLARALHRLVELSERLDTAISSVEFSNG